MKKFSSITRVNSRRISRNKKRLQIIFATCIALLLLFLIPRVLMLVGATVIAPINGVKTWLTQSGASLPVYFRNRSELIAQITDLQSQLAATGGDTYTARTLMKENQDLRRLLGVEEEQRILAGVIGRPNALPYDSLMLDKGSNDGVTVGAPVYVATETVIGVVKSVTPEASLVELITSPGFESTVYVLGPDIYTTAIGIGGGQLRVGVPQGISLAVGDMVVLPSTVSGIFGEISVVQSEPSQPEQYGFVSTKIPLASIRFVAIGKKPLIPITFQEAQKQLETMKSTAFLIDVPQDILLHATTTVATSSKEEGD